MRAFPAWTRSWWRMSLVTLLCALVLAVAARVAVGPPGAAIHVRWAAALDDSGRRQLEGRFRLTGGQPLDSSTWRYDLVDPSTDNLRLIVRHPAVEDTDGVDRTRFSLDADAVRTGRRLRFDRGDAVVSGVDFLSMTLAALAAVVALVGVSGRTFTWHGARLAVAAAVRAARVRRPGASPEPRLPAADGYPGRPRVWTAVTLAAVAPFVALLCLTLWRTPPPITEAVALFEDVLEQPLARFWSPNDTYYRPLFHVALAGAWTFDSVDATLGAIKLLTIVPVALLLVALIWHLRPRSPLDAAAASVAAVVLIGSPGFRDNLEIVLPYTIMGMCMAMLAWAVIERDERRWSVWVVVLCSLVAIGFKEQGLVVLPAILVAWWMRAPGATRSLAIATVVIGVAYVAFRLSGSAAWAPFEQDIGFGFTEMNRVEAAARFGAFPLWMYVYNSMSTIGNVLLSEPTRGVFQLVRYLVEGELPLDLILAAASSGALTILIAWWGLRAVKIAPHDRWSPESRLFLAVIVTTLASGALSFNYSRDRLGGMAAVFYAMAAFYAVRAAASRLLQASRMRLIAAACGLVLLTAVWSTRAVATLEHARGIAWGNQLQWFVLLPERELSFARRTTYQRVMASMIEQGRDPSAPRPTRYPRLIARVIGQTR